MATRTTTIVVSLLETTIIPAGTAGVFNDLILLTVANTSGFGLKIDIRDKTGGPVIIPLWVPSDETVVIPTTLIPLAQSSAANNWTAQCGTAVTDIRIFAHYNPHS